MPVLENPKHEAFVQCLAKGMSQAEAYAEAGYAPSEPNASRLTSNEKIKARLVELLETAAEQALVTVETIAAQLDEDRMLAHKEGQAGAAVSASMAKAKLYGLDISRSELKVLHLYADMSDEELDRELLALTGTEGATAH